MSATSERTPFTRDWLSRALGRSPHGCPYNNPEDCGLHNVCKDCASQPQEHQKMSFSFSVRAATKAALVLAVAAEMAKVAETQPAHKKDEALVNATAGAYINLLGTEPAEGSNLELSASVNGSVSWIAGTADVADNVTWANVGVSVGTTTKLAPPPSVAHQPV